MGNYLAMWLGGVFLSMIAIFMAIWILSGAVFYYFYECECPVEQVQEKDDE